jgi:hypothetical protein
LAIHEKHAAIAGFRLEPFATPLTEDVKELASVGRNQLGRCMTAFRTSDDRFKDHPLERWCPIADDQVVRRIRFSAARHDRLAARNRAIHEGDPQRVQRLARHQMMPNLRMLEP